MRKPCWIALCTVWIGCSSIDRMSESLRLDTTIELPSVKGGFDLMAADVAGRRLFVAAEDNNTVEVLDLVASRPVHSIAGVREPKWIVFLPETSKLYVANGGDGTVSVFDSKSYRLIKTIPFREKANNLRYDAPTGFLYVGIGKTFGAIGIINTRTDEIVGEIALANFPKQFELEQGGSRIFVNVPEANHVAVLDRKVAKQVVTWPVLEAKGNIPMALDGPGHRLLVGCEAGSLVVLDTATGKDVARVAISAGPDGVYWDASRRLIYISCGSGFIDVIRQVDLDRYESVDHIPTASGAATSLWVPELDCLFLAVPQHDLKPAAIRIYRRRP